MNSTLTIRLSARTDIGLKRSVNEDNFAVFEIPGTDAAFVVCDGMGGLSAGDIASAEATKAIEQALIERLGAGADPHASLEEALKRANDAVNRLPRPGGADDPTVRADGGEHGASGAIIGTTAVAGIVQGDALFLAHVGDSRAYRLRAERLERLTDDHSFVAEQVKAGNMTEAEARKSRFRNMITRAIGIEAAIVPELKRIELLAGDVILVCTDGLTTMLEDNEIEELMLSPRLARQSLEQQVLSLIEAANKRGGSDNVTVLLLRAFREGEAPERSASAIGPAPVRRDPAALSTMPVAESAAPTGGATKKRSATPSPLNTMLAAAGAVSLVGLIALMILPSLRASLAANLLQLNGVRPGTGAAAAPRIAAGSVPAEVSYAPPQELAASEIVRGDILEFVPGKGLFCINLGQGHGKWLDKDGKALAPPYPLPLLPEHRPSPEALKAQTFTTTDSAGNLYVCRTSRKAIEKFSPTGKYLARLPMTGAARPEAIAVDDSGNVFFVDNNVIKVIAATPKAARK